MEVGLNYYLIGKRIKSIRKKRGLTQEQLAELADISPQHCSGIETGGAKVSLPALVRICNALETSLDSIVADSLDCAPSIHLKDVAETFADCTSDEIYLMLSQADNLKQALRSKNLLPRKEKE